MQFIVQNNLINEDQLLKIDSSIKAYPHQYIGVIPFSHEIASEHPLDGVDFIPYGSTLLTTLAAEKRWTGLHFNEDVFTYTDAISNRDDMLNGEIVCTVEHAIDFLSGETGDWFIRPNKDLKQFSGQVIDHFVCAEWLKDATQCASSGTYQLSKDDLVILAKPKDIQAEWRWFVVDGKVIDGSMYRAHGQLCKVHETDINVIREAQRFADKWLPDSCCVMDLALVNDEVKVIEFNCINSSGFYTHNIEPIFKALYEFHTRG